RSIDLIGRDLDESPQLRSMFACFLEEDEDAVDIGLDERARFHQRAIDMRLGREVDNDIDPTSVDAFVRLRHIRRIGDVAVKKAVIALAFVFGEVLADTRVRELVEVDDLRIVTVFREQVTDEVRADETGPAGDGISHRSDDTWRAAVPAAVVARPA